MYKVQCKEVHENTTEEKIRQKDHQENKRQPTKLQKMFANHVSDKGLAFSIHKEFSQLKTKG